MMGRKGLLFVFSLIVLMSVLVVFACGPNRKETLTRTSKDFSASLRWDKLEAAKASLDGKILGEVGTIFNKVEGKINITDTEVKEVFWDEDEKKAVIREHYQWYVRPSVTLKQGYLIQTWEYKDSRWVLTHMEGDLLDDMKKLAAKQDEEEAAEDKEEKKGDEKMIPKTYERKPDL